MKNTKHLIIIPGLGDRVRRYRLVKPLWKILGYTVHIVSFGWNDSTETFHEALQRVAHYTDQLSHERMYVMGASAGGTAAINLATSIPSRITRVVTIATPYVMPKNISNDKLAHSIATMHPDSDLAILSFRGLYDGVVSSTTSKTNFSQNKKIYMIGHAYIIAVGLTLYAIAIHHFFTRK